MIKLFVNEKELAFTTTVFPDGTSQVWKIENVSFDGYEEIKIQWMFENEAELFHVCQLATLVSRLARGADIVLSCPYLPYARQDKELANNASFALSVAYRLLIESGVSRIEAFDVHSSNPRYAISSNSPTEFQKSILNHHIVCFPDKGAKDRYGLYLSINVSDTVFIHAEKIRNQDNGAITGLELVTGGVSLQDKKILIVDDICDGGMTFIKVAEELKKYNPTQIDLAVSHGLFSKGKQVLHDAGITNIFTTNSLLRNPDGFKVV